MAQAHLTQLEDGALCERVQRGLQAAESPPGRYAPHWVAGEHRFHGLLAADLRAALEP